MSIDPTKLDDADAVLNVMEITKSLFDKEPAGKNRDNLVKLYRDSCRHYRDLKASEHKTRSKVVKGCYRFLYAYEHALTLKNNKMTRASRLKMMVRNRIKYTGSEIKEIIKALEELVQKKGASSGFEYLMDNGYFELTAEYLVSQDKNNFTKEVRDVAFNKLIEYGMES